MGQNCLVYYINLFAIFAILCVAAEEDNKYKFILDNVLAEKEAEDVGKIKVELIKDNEDDGNVKMNGEAEQYVDFDNTWKLKIVLNAANEADEDYNEIFALPVLGVCDFMKFHYKMYIYDTLVKYANAPSPKDCPVIKNTYTLRDYPLVTEKFKKFLQPGYYRIEVSLYHEDEEKIKYSVEGHVIEEA